MHIYCLNIFYILTPLSYQERSRVRYLLFSFLIFLSSIFYLLSPTPTLAQIPEFGVATTYKIEDKNIDDGDIVSLSSGKATLARTKVSYDEKMYGVYIKFPKVVYRQAGFPYPIIRNGQTRVNVTTLNGPIKKGDYITSSNLIGKGQKATELTGYILGVAMEDYDGKSGKEITFEDKKYRQGNIVVSVGIGPASAIQIRSGGGLFGTVVGLGAQFFSSFQASKDFSRLMRYIIAGLVAAIAIFINFFTFGRNITQGIEAIGRNPLARLSIQSMIILNVVLIAVISLAAIGLSLAIIAF